MSATENLGPPFTPPPPVEDVVGALDAVGEGVSGALDAEEGVESGDSMGAEREVSHVSSVLDDSCSTRVRMGRIPTRTNDGETTIFCIRVDRFHR